VQDIQLESNVLKALNRIIETDKMKEAALNEAEAKRITLVKEAEADKESKKLIGEGMAEQRKAIAEGFKESVDMIKASDGALTGDVILKFLLDSARIETLEKVGRGDKAKIIYMNENLEATGSRVEKLLADK
jgi:regulator of protease activity HflC (stomatin/prohibitin superfamily)